MERRRIKPTRERPQASVRADFPVLPAVRFDITRALTPTAAAAMYGGTAGQLAVLRREWDGPVHYDFYGRILYMPEDVAFWITLHRKECLVTTIAKQAGLPEERS